MRFFKLMFISTALVATLAMNVNSQPKGPTKSEATKKVTIAETTPASVPSEYRLMASIGSSPHRFVRRTK